MDLLLEIFEELYEVDRDNNGITVNEETRQTIHDYKVDERR